MLVTKRPRTTNEAGSVLLWIMVAGLFTVGALGAATRLIPSGTVFTIRDADTTRAFIAAESGVNYMAYLIKEQGLGILDKLDEVLEGWEPAGLEAVLGGEFQVARDEEYVYIRGKFGDVERVLRARVLKPREQPQPKAPFELDVAVFAMAGPGARFPAIKVSGGAKIRESAGTNSVTEGAVRLEGGPIVGTVYVGPVSDEAAKYVVNKEHWIEIGDIVPLEEKRAYPLPPFPNPSTEKPWSDLPWRGTLETAWDRTRLIIDQSGRYDIIRAGSGDYAVVFDTSGGDLYVRANTVRAHGSGTFEVIGGGRLLLYVDKTFRLEGSGAFNRDGERSSVVIYYAGSDEFGLGGGTRANAIFHVKSAEVDVAGGFQGDVWIFSAGKKATLAGGASLERSGLIYAPLADVDVSGGARAVMVVGNSVHVSGGAELYNPTFDLRELEWAWAPVDDGEEEDEDYDVGETLEWHICWDCDLSIFEN